MDLEQKIDKFLEKKGKKSNFLIFLVIIICIGTIPLMFLDAFYHTNASDSGISGLVGTILFIVICISLFKDNIISFAVNTPKLIKNNSTGKEDIIIINATFKGYKDGGFLFINNNNKILVKRESRDAIGSLYFEKFLEEGRQYCILFSKYPDYPLAVFEGYYNGNKYRQIDL